MKDLTKYRAEREDWMPDLSGVIKYGDPTNDKYRGGHEGELNPNYKHGRRVGENGAKYDKVWYENNKHHYQPGGKYYKYKAKGDPRGRPRINSKNTNSEAST